MPIDGCTSTFAEIAGGALPRYMQDMRLAMRNPKPLAEFCTQGVGVQTIVKKQLKRTEDFSGCYVLLNDRTPFYVGISRRVVARLRQHGTGKSHFDASLAYSMAREKAPHKMTRDDAMKDPLFRREFEEARELLKDSSVALIEIANPLELYLFEAFCAMELDTSKWNTFRTH